MDQKTARQKASEPKVLLSGHECEVLIPLLAEGTCKIKDIKVVYDLIYKLQACIDETEKHNNKS